MKHIFFYFILIIIIGMFTLTSYLYSQDEYSMETSLIDKEIVFDYSVYFLGKYNVNNEKAFHTGGAFMLGYSKRFQIILLSVKVGINWFNCDYTYTDSILHTIKNTENFIPLYVGIGYIHPWLEDFMPYVFLEYGMNIALGNGNPISIKTEETSDIAPKIGIIYPIGKTFNLDFSISYHFGKIRSYCGLSLGMRFGM